MVHFETRDFVAWLDGVEQRLENASLAEASTLADLAKAEMNQHNYQNRTGRLTASMSARTARTGGMGFVSIVEIKAPYALWVDEPTKPHVIEAKNATYLRFKVRGSWVMTKRVHHPGTRGAWFSLRAWTFYSNVCSTRFQRAVDSAITGAG